MKKKFTLLFTLYFCFKLSAFAIHSDTLKLSSATNNSDSAMLSASVNYTTQSIKLTTTSIQQHYIKLSAQINSSDSIKLATSVFTHESANISVPDRSDSLKLSVATIKKDSTKFSGYINHDVKLITDLPIPDSLKFLGPINQGVKLITDLPIPDNTKLSAPVNHRDSLKLSEYVLLPEHANFSMPNHSDSIKLVTAIIPKDSTKFLVPKNHSIKSISDLPISDNTKLPLSVNSAQNLKSLTSAIQLDSLRSSALLAEIQRNNIKQQIRYNYQVNLARLLRLNDLDSLKQQVKLTANDTLKAFIYSRIAAIYLTYDTIRIKKMQVIYQNQAIAYTLLAIQKYAVFNDSTALRKSFDNLAKVYYSQKKYSQAKWFILQSNTLSRAKNDVPNTISSLLTLSLVKRDIKDYTLAMSDLNEALQLSITNHSPKTELEVLKNYALLYHRLKNYPKEASILKKRDSLNKSILKNEKAQLIAKLAVKNEPQKKKSDSLQNKKKLYSSNTRRLYKNNSPRKIDSL